MKSEFKKWLKLHRGKLLTNDIIEMIASRHEDEIGDMLYNEGLCLESIDNGMNIFYGNCEKDDTNWAVQDMWVTQREFKTLRGAINYVNRG